MAPEIDHSAPGILDLARGRLHKHARLNVVRNLIAQILFNFFLDLVLVQMIDAIGIDPVITEESLVTLVELPERLIGPLAIDPEMRGQF